MTNRRRYDETSVSWVAPSADSRSADLGARCSPVNLVQAADAAMYCAKRAGRAQAMLLDIADADTPQMARDITPALRKPRDARWDASRANVVSLAPRTPSFV